MPNSAAFKRALDQAANQTVVQGDSASSVERPDYVNELCDRQRADVAFVRDVYGGTGVLRKRKETYLPRLSNREDDDDYQRRLERAVLFNAVKRTAKGLVGMIFEKDPILEGVPDSIVEAFDDIDLGGRALPVFAKDIAHGAVLDGHSFIYVDAPPKLRITMPSGEERDATVAEERAAGVRPYWVEIGKNQVINVQWESRGGAPSLALFVYREQATEPVGTFGERTVDRYRVLRPGSFEVWQEDKAGDKLTFHLIESGTTSLDYIPVAPVYADQTGYFESAPPLLDLAYENIVHWQNRNEHQMSLSRVRVPMPFLTGVEPDKIIWGPTYSIIVPNEKATASMLESSGSGLSDSRDDLKDTEMRMAALGLSMLVRETRAAETAEGKRIDRSESDSQLATIARGVQDGLELALWFHADYMKIDRQSVGKILVNDDFADKELSPQMLQVLLSACESNRITNATLWSIMQSGGILPEDFDGEIEADALEGQTGDALVSMAKRINRERLAEAA